MSITFLSSGSYASETLPSIWEPNWIKLSPRMSTALSLFRDNYLGVLIALDWKKEMELLFQERDKCSHDCQLLISIKKYAYKYVSQWEIQTQKIRLMTRGKQWVNSAYAYYYSVRTLTYSLERDSYFGKYLLSLASSNAIFLEFLPLLKYEEESFILKFPRGNQ